MGEKGRVVFSVGKGKGPTCVVGRGREVVGLGSRKGRETGRTERGDERRSHGEGVR